MEILKPNILKPSLRRIGLYKPSMLSADKPHSGKVKPYIAGHVTDGSSTFTFKVNGSDVTVSVSGGDWKYKPTVAITSLAFVGVPQLESLELNNITGVSTFNLDYPVVPVFKNCDATTEAALNYVYHIRGTAAADFDFTLKYVDESNNVTTVTESAVIDGDGKWDISYSGKKIKELYNTFNDNLLLTNIQFTEKLNELTSLYGTFRHCYNCVSIVFAKGTTLPKCTTINRCFCVLNFCESVLNTDGFILQNCNDFTYSFDTCKKIKYFDFSNCVGNPTGNLYSSFFYNWPELETLHLDNFNVGNYNINADGYAFRNCSKLVNLYLPQDAKMGFSFTLQHSPLSYDSMLRVASWLKDLTGGTAQTVTFKADTYNALTAEQKAELTAIIVTQKGWNLATA